MTARSKGVSLYYLLHQFPSDLCKLGIGDLSCITFYDLEKRFWKCECPTGFLGSQGKKCPRDGRLGCALVDALDPKFQDQATDYVSWCWGYTVQDFLDALDSWAESVADLKKKFLWICFWCNNQRAIAIDGQAKGSDNLASIFEERLTEIKSMLVVLDRHSDPKYCSRIFCIYEIYLYTCLEENIQDCSIKLTMPTSQQEEMRRQKIDTVKLQFEKINAEKAEAYNKFDEDAIKDEIYKTHGDFEKVNLTVKELLSKLILSPFMQASFDVSDDQPSLPADGCPSDMGTIVQHLKEVAVDEFEIDSDAHHQQASVAMKNFTFTEVADGESLLVALKQGVTHIRLLTDVTLPRQQLVDSIVLVEDVWLQGTACATLRTRIHDGGITTIYIGRGVTVHLQNLSIEPWLVIQSDAYDARLQCTHCDMAEVRLHQGHGVMRECRVLRPIDLNQVCGHMGYWGLYVSESASLDMQNCSVSGSMGNGIQIGEDGKEGRAFTGRVQIRGASVIDCQNDGISVLSLCTTPEHISLHGCTISGNRRFGIYLPDPNHAMWVGGIIERNGKSNVGPFGALQASALLGYEECSVGPGTSLESIIDEINRDPSSMNRVLPYLTENSKFRDACLAAVARDPSALKHADAKFRADPEFVRAAVTNSRGGWAALQYADAKLRADCELVLAAVEHDFRALKHADAKLRADRNVVLAAAANSGYALQYADAELRKDREVMLAVAAKKRSGFKLKAGFPRVTTHMNKVKRWSKFGC